MSYIRLLYESLPDSAKHITKKGYNSITKAEVRSISYLLDKNIISTLDRSDLKSHPEIDYHTYDEAEQHTFVAPTVPRKNDIIEKVIRERIDYRGSPATLCDMESHKYSIKCHEPFVAELPHTNIFGPHALVRTRNRELPIEIKANIRGRSGSFDSMFRSTLRWFGRINTMRSIIKYRQYNQNFDVAASILTGRKNTTPAYGHWLVEILPRIRGIRYYQRQTGRSPTILVNPNITDWQIKTLELVGINTENLKKWSGGKASVDRYVLPMWAKNEWCTNDIQWVKEKIKNKVDYEKHLDRFSSRVYISRENMGRRQVINREELVDAISDYGFESYSPELMTFSEQVALYENADILIGPKGSGFANIIFSTNADVIELFPHNYFHLWQFELSQVLNHRYYPIFGDRVNPPLKNHYQDCRIPPDQATELIGEIVRENNY